MSYTVAHLDEIDEITDGRCPWRPIRHHLGIRSFGINSWTGKSAGDRLINEHDESGDEDSQEELYFVHTGRARFELDGEAVDAPAGAFVLVPPGVKRTAFAEEPGTTLLAIGGTPGQAYVPGGWELWAPFSADYQAGNYAAAADAARPVVEANPEYPVLWYNLACCESLAGRGDDAIAHLKVAFQTAGMSDGLRRLAAEDSDLDPIRERPDFTQLLA
jgi:tetratricopeptide (TPR) repeat protein